MAKVRRALLLAVWATVAVVGCAETQHELIVEVRSPLAPGTDFDVVTTELFDERGTFGERLRRVETPAVEGDDFVAGHRVAELADLDAGFYVLTVRLSLSGAEVAVEMLPVELTADRAVTLMVGALPLVVSDAGVDGGLDGSIDAGASDSSIDGGGGITVPAGMVFVPAGSFLMGCNAALDSQCLDDENPQHEVTLSAFFIDRTELSQVSYVPCIDAGSCPSPMGFDRTSNRPTIHVSQAAASAYCRWAGKRLPTEAEWEKAARGTDARVYPWGNEPPSCERANYEGCLGMHHAVDLPSTGDSPYGAMHMSGNVWEWVLDFYAADYYASSPATDPGGPTTGTSWPIRGGASDWPSSGARASKRLEWDHATAAIGFRCALLAE